MTTYDIKQDIVSCLHVVADTVKQVLLESLNALYIEPPPKNVLI